MKTIRVYCHSKHGYILKTIGIESCVLQCNGFSLNIFVIYALTSRKMYNVNNTVVNRYYYMYKIYQIIDTSMQNIKLNELIKKGKERTKKHVLKSNYLNGVEAKNLSLRNVLFFSLKKCQNNLKHQIHEKRHYSRVQLFKIRTNRSLLFILHT